MAPKGAKRSNATATTGRPRKVAKPSPQEEQLQAVAQALEAMADLPESCRAMLLAVLPTSLGVFQDTRHEVQERAVTMIGDTLAKVQSEKEAALAQAGEKAAAAEGKQAELHAVHAGAESALEAKTKVMQEKKAALDAASSRLADAKAVLASKQQEQQTAKDQEAAKKDECTAFDASVGEHFAPLKEGAWDEGAPAGRQHLDALDATLKKAQLDSSLTASLRISGSKRAAERTNFDSMVLEQVGSSLAEKADSLKKELADKGPAVAACGEAVAAHALEVEKAEGQVQECKSAFEQAQAEQQETDVAWKAAAQELKAHAAEAKKVAKDREATQAELETFASGPKAAFEALKGATRKAAEAAVEVAAATEEGAMPVTVGGA